MDELAALPKLAIVRAEDLARMEAKIDALTKMIEGATITPRPEWVSVPEAARRMDCCTATIRRKVQSGEIEARGSGKMKQVKVGG